MDRNQKERTEAHVKNKPYLHSQKEVKRTGRLQNLFQQKGLTPYAVRIFREIIYDYYRSHGRTLPWRNTKNPYHILVSEIMLQQTQVERVIQKYDHFIKTFPDFASLAGAPLRRVLEAWQGLGYNRRAKALKEIAQAVMTIFGGRLPSSGDDLQTFPGIGKATASSIAAFAFDQPSIFIETNIRRVFIHFFFHNKDDIKDSEILPLVERTLDKTDPREWYYALMDYGVMLKKELPNPNRRSAHYKRQPPFEGSDRQIRGKILRALVENSSLSKSELNRKIDTSPERSGRILAVLKKEGFVKKTGRRYRLA